MDHLIEHLAPLGLNFNSYQNFQDPETKDITYNGVWILEAFHKDEQPFETINIWLALLGLFGNEDQKEVNGVFIAHRTDFLWDYVITTENGTMYLVTP